jgi:hypothetical protein
MNHFVPYYINALEESHLVSRAKELTRSEKKLLDEYTAREGSRDIDGMMDVGKGGDWGGEKYEMSVAKHGDKIFHKFKKALSFCPNQCLRYGKKAAWFFVFPLSEFFRANREKSDLIG